METTANRSCFWSKLDKFCFHCARRRVVEARLQSVRLSGSPCCRLVELAPQYYLGNLPPSDGRELLMELRGHSGAELQPEEHAARGAEAQDGSAPELCVIQ